MTPTERKLLILTAQGVRRLLNARLKFLDQKMKLMATTEKAKEAVEASIKVNEELIAQMDEAIEDCGEEPLPPLTKKTMDHMTGEEPRPTLRVVKKQD